MLIDPQRNLLTTVLVAGLGVLALAGAASWLVFGRANVDAIQPASISDPALVRSEGVDSALGELSRYAVITDRPVFFEDRRLPVVEGPGDDEEMLADAELDPGVDIPSLDAKVAGIMITPDFKLAMVDDGSGGRVQVLREGMALEGEYAGWRLEEIRARSVRFVADDGKEASVEMQVETRALAGAPAQATRASASRRGSYTDTGESATPDEPDDQAQAEARARAEEVRRRVAERRAQLRAEAERRARQRDQQP